MRIVHPVEPTMISTHRNLFGNLATTCIACGRDPGLKHWHFEGDLLCWPCWLRVEHLGHDVGDVMEACRAFHRGDGDSTSAAARDDLAALGLLGYEWY